MNPNENTLWSVVHAPKIGVFWDVDDYPATDIDSFAHGVRLAMQNAGYTGVVSITAYGTKEPDELMRGLYDDAGITFVFKASKIAKLLKMLTDMFLWDSLARRAGGRADGAANMMLISKGILSKKEDQDEAQKEARFLPFVLGLHYGGPNMLYVVPDDFQPNNLPYRQLFPKHPLYPEWQLCMVLGWPFAWR